MEGFFTHLCQRHLRCSERIFFQITLQLENTVNQMLYTFYITVGYKLSNNSLGHLVSQFKCLG